MENPRWKKILDRPKRSTFAQTPEFSYKLDTSLDYVDCSCKAKKIIDRHYRYIEKKIDQLKNDSYQLRSEQNDLYNREAQFSKSLWQLKSRERELDDYCTYLNEKRQNISNMYNKCEILNSQINERFNEYNSLQSELKKKLEDIEKRHSILAEREEKVGKFAHDLDLKERELSKLHNQDHSKYIMDIEQERRKLFMDREKFTEYYEDMLDKLDRKWQKLDTATNLYRTKYDEMLTKEKQLNLDKENIKRAWDNLEQAQLANLREKEALKTDNTADPHHFADNSNKSNLPFYDAAQYNNSDNNINPLLTAQLQDKMADINKLIEDIKQQTSLLAVEKCSLQGQKKQFELEKAISERELLQKEQQLLNLENKLRKNDLVEHGTPTIINSYYNDKLKAGDSSTRFTDIDKDGTFFLDRSTGINSYKPTYQTTTERNNYDYRQRGMKDIRDYGKLF